MFNYLKVRKNVESLNSWITQMSNKPARKKLKYGWAIVYLLSLPGFRQDIGKDRAKRAGIAGIRKVVEEKPHLFNGY